MAEGVCALREASAGRGSLAGSVVLWRTHTGAHFLKDCAPWKGPTLEQGKNVSSPLTEEDRAAQAMCTELTTAPIAHFSDIVFVSPYDKLI